MPLVEKPKKAYFIGPPDIQLVILTEVRNVSAMQCLVASGDLN